MPRLSECVWMHVCVSFSFFLCSLVSLVFFIFGLVGFCYIMSNVFNCVPFGWHNCSSYREYASKFVSCWLGDCRFLKKWFFNEEKGQFYRFHQHKSHRFSAAVWLLYIFDIFCDPISLHVYIARNVYCIGPNLFGGYISMLECGNAIQIHHDCVSRFSWKYIISMRNIEFYTSIKNPLKLNWSAWCVFAVCSVNTRNEFT